MQYKLVFIKTNPTHAFAGVGVGGNVMMSLSMISNMTDEDSLYVDMGTHECIWTEKDLSYQNAWEYFFYQKELDLSREVNTLSCQETGPTSFRYDDDNIGMHPVLYTQWKNRFYNNFKLKPALKISIDDYYNTFLKGRITLGVQIRLTDQIYHHKTKGFSESMCKINEILKERPEIEQVFLATDDATIIPVMKSQLHLPIVYQEGIFRADETHRHNNPYDRVYSTRKMHRYLLGMECLQDIFLLTQCDYFLKAHRSAISIVTCILADNIKQVYRL
jgi:hypothetical protein